VAAVVSILARKKATMLRKADRKSGHSFLGHAGVVRKNLPGEDPGARGKRCLSLGVEFGEENARDAVEIRRGWEKGLEVLTGG